MEKSLIKTYLNYYATSNGSIYSLKRKGSKGGVVLGSPCKDGYLQIRLYKNNVGKAMLIHRIIADTFLNPDPSKPEVNHKNGIKTDNRVENLEWVSRQENIIHARKNRFRMNMLTDKEIDEIKNSKRTGIELSKLYKRSKAMISLIKNNKLYKLNSK